MELSGALSALGVYNKVAEEPGGYVIRSRSVKQSVSRSDVTRYIPRNSSVRPAATPARPLWPCLHTTPPGSHSRPERDYQKACRAIQAAGYATAPDYAAFLRQFLSHLGQKPQHPFFQPRRDGRPAKHQIFQHAGHLKQGEQQAEQFAKPNLGDRAGGNPD